MFYNKSDFPEENDIVICTVTKLQFHSIFVSVDEYKKPGMIHISEISPGRIRNIRDYVKEGKVIICKVLRVNKERNQIDLSLRRVNEAQRRAKNEWIKQEQRAEKLVEFIAKQNKMEAKELYDQIKDKILKEYDSFHEAFEDVVESDAKIEALGIEADLAKQFEAEIRIRIKPKKVEIVGFLNIKCYEPNGVNLIKENLIKFHGKNDEITLSYLGGGRYKVDVESTEYKEAENSLKNFIEPFEKSLKKYKCEIEFSRENN